MSGACCASSLRTPKGTLEGASWPAESLKPKLSKISPGAGFGRLFSKIALANFVKGLIKLVIIGSVIGAVLWPKRHQFDALVAMDPAVVMPLVQSLSLEMLGTVV